MSVMGSILGDIAGSQYEFEECRPQNGIDWKNCELFTENCFFTDDTVQTVALKYAIKNNIPYDQALMDFGKRYLYVGYGLNFRKWLSGDEDRQTNSLGNGAAMRVSYIGEHFETLEDVCREAEKATICTHNHPEAIKGAVSTATAVWMAKHGANKTDLFEFFLKQYPEEDYLYSISRPLKEYKESYHYDVTCQNSVPVAMRCFLESEDFESFLRLLLSFDCDMDTLGAIGGGVAEEYYGTTGMNNEELLKRYVDEYLHNIIIQ